jgi:hypothetical protein
MAALSNQARGTAFEERAAKALATHTGMAFQLRVPLDIGDPPKRHIFDLAAADRMICGEAKTFTFTATGNVPSAKISTLREAAQYLQLLPPSTQGFIVMSRDCHPRTDEPLG